MASDLITPPMAAFLHRDQQGVDKPRVVLDEWLTKLDQQQMPEPFAGALVVDTSHQNDPVTWMSVAGGVVSRDIVSVARHVTATQPYEIRPDGTVYFKTHLMENGRPYPFKIEGSWFIAVRHPGKGIGVYYIHE